MYKQILIRRYTFLTYEGRGRKEGPLQNFLQIADNYGLLPTVEQAIETGADISLVSWKKYVKSLVIARDEREWAVKSHMFPSLQRLNSCVPKLKVNAWWMFVQKNPNYVSKCKIILKLFLEVHLLNSRRYKFVNDVNPECDICDSSAPETVEHILFDCIGLNDIRKTLWNDVLQACPSETLKDHIMTMSLLNRTNFLLNCMGNGYVAEWNEFFSNIAIFISTMYNKRIISV